MVFNLSLFLQIGGLLPCGIILSISHTTLSFSFYWPSMNSSLLISDPYTLEGTVHLQHRLLFSLVTFIVSLLYSYRFRFSLWWLLGIGLVFCFTIITFGEFILLYFLAYELFALLAWLLAWVSSMSSSERKIKIIKP